MLFCTFWSNSWKDALIVVLKKFFKKVYEVSLAEAILTKRKQSHQTLTAQGRWNWVRRVRICAPNVWAMSRENMDFAHPIFEPYFIYCAPNIKLLPPPLQPNVILSHIVLTHSRFPRKTYRPRSKWSTVNFFSLNEQELFVDHIGKFSQNPSVGRGSFLPLVFGQFQQKKKQNEGAWGELNPTLPHERQVLLPLHQGCIVSKRAANLWTDTWNQIIDV